VSWYTIVFIISVWQPAVFNTTVKLYLLSSLNSHHSLQQLGQTTLLSWIVRLEHTCLLLDI